MSADDTDLPGQQPVKQSLFEAPVMGEQERMVEAILFATCGTRHGARAQRPDAAWL